MIRLRHTGRATLATAGIALAVLVLPTDAAAQGGVKYHQATITFTDAPTSSSIAGTVRLTGDGLPYENATIVTAPAGTLSLMLTKTNRRLRVTLQDGVALSGPLPAGTGPGQGVTYVAGSELSVFGVRSIGVGSSAVREMGIVVDEIKRGYRLKFYPGDAGTGVEEIGTKVCVSRTHPTQWMISTLAAGDECGTSGDTSGGETTRLVDQGKSATVQLGAYIMPFSFHVSCPSCQ